MFRAAASGGIAVNLVEGGYIEWTLATSSKCDVTIVDVRYTNSGLSDAIELLPDEVPVGSFKQLAVFDKGRMWNVFRSSCTLGKPVSLSANKHTLKLIVRTADKPGVEIDKVTLNSSCIGYSSNATDYGQLSTTDTGIIAIIPNGMPTSDAEVTSFADDSAEIVKIVIPPVIGVAGILSTVLLRTIGIYCKYKKSKRNSLQQFTPLRAENNEAVPTGDID